MTTNGARNRLAEGNDKTLVEFDLQRSQGIDFQKRSRRVTSSCQNTLDGESEEPFQRGESEREWFH